MRGKTDPDAQLRLFCLPYAGAGASRYFHWMSSFPREIEVCPILLPGREARLSEDPFTRMDDLLPALAKALGPECERPFAIFGHSMGALIAFELARRLRREFGTSPIRLFASGHRAPHLRRSGPILHGLPSDEFAVRIRQLEDAPGATVWHDEYMELMLPTLRADFKLCETYVYKVDAPLECPILAFGGLHDRRVRKADLAAWAAQTSGAFWLRMFPGGHLFLNECETDVVRSIAEDLSYALAAKWSIKESLEGR
jgi:medium-chain acyl-[acyl-carrier-protein] hydrolase